jgi:hypothetical protein
VSPLYACGPPSVKMLFFLQQNYFSEPGRHGSSVNLEATGIRVVALLAL